MKYLILLSLLILGGRPLLAHDPWENEPIPWRACKPFKGITFTENYVDEVSVPYILTGSERPISIFWYKIPFTCMIVKNMKNIRFKFIHDPKLKNHIEITDEIEHSLVEKLKMSKRYTLISRDEGTDFYEYILDGRDVPVRECGEPPYITIRINLDDDFKFHFKDCENIDLQLSVTPEDKHVKKFDYPVNSGFKFNFLSASEGF